MNSSPWAPGRLGVLAIALLGACAGTVGAGTVGDGTGGDAPVVSPDPTISEPATAEPETAVTAPEAPAPKPPAPADPMFAKVDVNGDAHVTRGEFDAYAAPRLGNAGPEYLAKLFAAIDLDHDGGLSAAEFARRREALRAVGRPPRAERNLADKESDYDAHHRRVVARDTFLVLDEPEMTPAALATLADDEPVIGVVCDGEARAYTVAVMGRHELVNDVCGKTPIAASW